MIKRVLNHPTVQQFSRFITIGFLNTGLDWAIFFALTSWVPFFTQHILIANAISFVFGFTNSYIFNRRWTFKSQDARVGRQLTVFLLINLAGLGISQTILGTVYAVTSSRLISKATAVALTLFWNYFAGRKFAFKK
ncbi:MAG: GtrA family protein [bacterium]|nr:GtrA family protein [bacterium]